MPELSVRARLTAGKKRMLQNRHNQSAGLPALDAQNSISSLKIKLAGGKHDEDRTDFG
jgi:hypothetical protein